MTKLIPVLYVDIKGYPSKIRHLIRDADDRRTICGRVFTDAYLVTRTLEDRARLCRRCQASLRRREQDQYLSCWTDTSRAAYKRLIGLRRDLVQALKEGRVGFVFAYCCQAKDEFLLLRRVTPTDDEEGDAILRLSQWIGSVQADLRRAKREAHD